MAHNYGPETLEALYPVRTDIKNFWISGSVKGGISYSDVLIGVTPKVFNYITAGPYFLQFGGEKLKADRLEPTKRSEKYFLQLAKNFKIVEVHGKLFDKFHNELQDKYPPVFATWNPDMVVTNTHITYAMSELTQNDFPYDLRRIAIMFEPDVCKPFADSYDFVRIVCGELMRNLIPVPVETCELEGSITFDDMRTVLESCNWKHINFRAANPKKLTENIVLSSTILSIKPGWVAEIYSDQLEANNSYLYRSRFAKVKAIIEN